MRIAILSDGRTLARWQRRAVESIAADHRLFLLACAEAPRRRNLRAHAFYYALNLLTIRNCETRRVPFPEGALSLAGRFDCLPEMDGAWARLPEKAIDWLRDQHIDAVIKFGLSLLTVPSVDVLPVPILSYHHGDPRVFRGRPSGFYEMREGVPYLGQIIQRLSNRVDAGEVLAFGQTRAQPHSYRATLVEAFRLSPLLLPMALANLAAGRTLPLAPTGRNYRLPSSSTVLTFSLQAAKHFLARLAYGAAVEKQWRVASLDVGKPADPIAALHLAADRCAEWQETRPARSHSFHADPFFYGGRNDIIVEALNRRTGKGELVRIRGTAHEIITGVGGHYSYPGSIEEGGHLYLVPETVQWCDSAAWTLSEDKLRHASSLQVPGTRRLLDPTLLRHSGRVFLFANRLEEGAAVLRLWHAAGLFEPFIEHPRSPVRLSVRGGRMAGPVRRWPAGLFRLGQDLGAGYGDGIVAFRISELTTQDYAEEEAGAFAFSHVRGPHTVSMSGSTLMFDWYRNRFSPLAGVRRLLSRR